MPIPTTSSQLWQGKSFNPEHYHLVPVLPFLAHLPSCRCCVCLCQLIFLCYDIYWVRCLCFELTHQIRQVKCWFWMTFKESLGFRSTGVGQFSRLTRQDLPNANLGGLAVDALKVSVLFSLEDFFEPYNPERSVWMFMYLWVWPHFILFCLHPLSKGLSFFFIFFPAILAP